MKNIKGQLNLFDIHYGKLKPSDYRWNRYIGQQVGLRCGVTGKITKIEPYYTIILGKDVDGEMRYFAGTPYDCWPIDET